MFKNQKDATSPKMHIQVQINVYQSPGTHIRSPQAPTGVIPEHRGRNTLWTITKGRWNVYRKKEDVDSTKTIWGLRDGSVAKVPALQVWGWKFYPWFFPYATKNSFNGFSVKGRWATQQMAWLQSTAPSLCEIVNKVCNLTWEYNPKRWGR